MRLSTPSWFWRVSPSNYGECRAATPSAQYLATFLALLCILQSLATATPGHAQQANQPGFDPRQTEKYFDDRQSGPDRPVRPPPRTPTLARPDVKADSKPLFVLRAVSIAGASAMPRDALAASYRS